MPVAATETASRPRRGDASVHGKVKGNRRAVFAKCDKKIYEMCECAYADERAAGEAVTC